MSLLQKTIDAIKPLDEKAMDEAQKRLDFLLKPQGSLGKLEDIAKRVAGITGKVQNTLDKRAVMVMCADNGVFEEQVAISAQAVSMLVADCMVRGLSGVSVLARHADADLKIVDLGMVLDVESTGIINRKIRRSTSNFVKEPAMTRDEAIRAIEIGIEETLKAIDEGYNLLGTGEIGIANTTTSSAMMHVFTGASLDDVVGRGAGLDDKGLQRKKNSIRIAVEKHKPDPKDPIDVLAKVGGFDIAGMAGTFLAAASRRVPVVIDGFISGAAAVLAYRLCPEAINFMFPSHGSAEPGAQIVAKELGLDPMLYMNMRLGEGSGAALAFHLMGASMYMMNNQGTFADIKMLQTGEEVK
jgi:nicotinate-nucleotide--dimethylbenzimidazole phosphoribosyltransferase